MNNLNILYEDKHIIVVLKPRGILSQADITGNNDMLTIIKGYLKEKYHKPGNVYLGLVHRLDKETSGIMVFARTSKAAKRLSENIKNHEFQKSYLAVVHGKPSATGILKDYLEKKGTKSFISTKENGKYAELSYELLKYNSKEDLSLLKINLKTGRNHQIRLQFQSRNFPLYGDSKYGNDINKNLGLFAYQLVFPHPISKELMKFEIKPDYSPFTKFNEK